MNHTQQVRVTFYGGVGWVTGANFLLENIVGEGEQLTKIMVDCGMFQGGDNATTMNHEAFHYDPATIDVLIITHAHADHIGRVPKLVKDGFRGTIYSTEATYDLARIMLADSLEIINYEAKEKNSDPLYTEQHVRHALDLWKHIPYHNPLTLPGGFVCTLYDAGHILGSAMAKFTYANKQILFTGDVGNSPDPLLRDTEIIDDVDYMVIESVYGDRNHEEREERIAKLKNVIMETIAKHGVLMIPSFALERTQNLLFILNDLIEQGEVPHIPVFLDSPLAIDITNVFRKHTHLFNQNAQERLQHDTDIFSFPGFKETYSVNDSKAIMKASNPKIIISSAGMSHAGRIIHHEKQYLDDRENTILFVGYQAVGTGGRVIQDGAKKITILGKEVRIRARIETISGYSAHKDSEHLVEFVSHSAHRLQQVFVAMGETKSSLFLVQRIRDYLGVKATAPNVDESVVLDMS
ncbi:MBL fold metallo-hydrolase [Patescibacteria group bacterium]|nr:MBL fold metallo-hydrolase [Patescibacteria group bacterium]